MKWSFLTDEHVNRVYITELRANGYDVARVNEDYDQGTSDPALLERSRESDRVIISNDADFARLQDEYDHAGCVLYNDQNVSVTEFMQGIKRLERFVPEGELRNDIVWLDGWME
jgi:predicted nuclease of predicted toxin-antitoxin system